MMNTKKIIQRARKSVAFGRMVAISSPGRGESAADVDHVCSTSSSALASKGHLFVYTIEGKRFTIPLEYLNSNIFVELLKISEEEFGLRRDGPIMLHCDAPCLEYIISFLRSRVSRDIETALLTFINQKIRCSEVVSYGIDCQQLPVCGF